MACPKHPRYQGMLEPMEDCLDCWKVYGRKWRKDYRMIYDLLLQFKKRGSK